MKEEKIRQNLGIFGLSFPESIEIIRLQGVNIFKLNVIDSNGKIFVILGIDDFGGNLVVGGRMGSKMGHVQIGRVLDHRDSGNGRNGTDSVPKADATV